MRQSKLILGGLDSTQVKPATEKLGDEPYTLQGPTQAHLENGLENDEEDHGSVIIDLLCICLVFKRWECIQAGCEK